MDTGTVLKVIEMITKRMNTLEKYKDHSDLSKGGLWALEDLHNHLQSFIEGEVNAVENQSYEQ